MNQHHYILGLGSNRNADDNIAYAIQKLRKHFNTIRISTPVETEPIGMPNDFMFLNCVAILDSGMNTDELKAICKSIEKECGRCIENKEKGIINLDIDIIKADNIVLKEDDLKRDFIIDGIKELKA